MVLWPYVWSIGNSCGQIYQNEFISNQGLSAFMSNFHCFIMYDNVRETAFISLVSLVIHICHAGECLGAE